MKIRVGQYLSSRTMTAMSERWGFIGAGKMASALALGMIRAGVTSPESIRTYDPVKSCADHLGTLGVLVLESNQEVAAGSDVLVLAVKPQAMPGVLAELEPAVGPGHLVISIAAGVPMATLAAGLGPE